MYSLATVSMLSLSWYGSGTWFPGPLVESTPAHLLVYLSGDPLFSAYWALAWRVLYFGV